MTDYTPVSASQHGKTLALHYENEEECTAAFAALPDETLAAFPRLKQERDELLKALEILLYGVSPEREERAIKLIAKMEK